MTNYLIVVDDVWNTTTWDHLRRLFPDDGNGSRIILTTRVAEVAVYASCDRAPHQMCFLSIEQGWELLSGKVFGKLECCPPELEKIGKQIVFKCGGLPLAILVVAGLLSKANKTIDEWKNVLENINADEDCFGILGLSYHQLDIHLKCCFVYMAAVFPEDALIPVPKLIKLWIAEGFVEEVEGASFEETAEAYLEELIDRSLVLISKRGYDGKPKTCMVHDLLREFCLREANTQKFLLLINTSDTALPAAHIKFHRRFIFKSMKWEEMEKFLKTSTPNTCRSILTLGISSFLRWRVEPKFWRFKLLRVLDASSVSFTNYSFLHTFDVLIDLRYLAVGIVKNPADSFPSIEQLEFLQTFIVYDRHPTSRKFLGIDREMKELRHLELGSCGMICFLHNSGIYKVLLPNLKTLSRLCPSSCSQELFGNFPNLKKLGITYYYANRGQSNCLESVHLLHNIEALKFQYMDSLPYGKTISQKLILPDIFPLNLKKLSLLKSCLPWKDITILARLPFLEVLKLKRHAFMGPEWETTQEGFQALKVLVLQSLDLVHWKTSSDHFPRLQSLVIRKCKRLEGVPPEIGDILTLQELELDRSNCSLVDSAQEILEQQRDWGNDEFHVHFNSTPRFSK